MKNFIKFFLCQFTGLFLITNAQIKTNSDKCFNILLENHIVYGAPSKFIIINNTNKNYLVNIEGFIGNSEIFENGKKILPFKPKIFISHAEWDEEKCRENILLVEKNTKITSPIYLDIFKGYYNILSSYNYQINFESTHTVRSPYYFGCKKYVDSLVNEGFEIYDGTLKGNVKLIPKDRN